MSLFQQLNEAAAREGLRYIVIGGHAVIAHGFQRGTEDADILVDKTAAQSWRRLIEGLGYRLRHDGGAFVQFAAPDEASWDLDVMLVPAETFERLADEVVPTHVEGVPVKLVGFRNLLALKIHALKHGRHLRVLKDMEDIVQLVLANRVDVRSDWFRQLFEKHGTPEHYERIVRLATP